MNWAAISTGIAFLSLCGGAFEYLRRRLRGRKIITYELLASVPFLRDMPGIESAGLSVIYDGEKLADPHLLQVQVTSKSALDIPTKAFDQARPLCFDVGVPVIALLETTFDPDQAPLPEIMTNGSVLQVQPSLTRRRQDMTFSVLADGPGAHLTCSSNPLLNYTPREGKSDQERRRRNIKIRNIVVWAIVLFMVFYVVTHPAAAGQAVEDLGNGVANLLNSL